MYEDSKKRSNLGLRAKVFSGQIPWHELHKSGCKHQITKAEVLWAPFLHVHWASFSSPGHCHLVPLQSKVVTFQMFS